MHVEIIDNKSREVKYEIYADSDVVIDDTQSDDIFNTQTTNKVNIHKSQEGNKITLKGIGFTPYISIYELKVLSAYAINRSTHSLKYTDSEYEIAFCESVLAGEDELIEFKFDDDVPGIFEITILDSVIDRYIKKMSIANTISDEYDEYYTDRYCRFSNIQYLCKCKIHKSLMEIFNIIHVGDIINFIAYGHKDKQYIKYKDIYTSNIFRIIPRIENVIYININHDDISEIKIYPTFIEFTYLTDGNKDVKQCEELIDKLRLSSLLYMDGESFDYSRMDVHLYIPDAQFNKDKLNKCTRLAEMPNASQRTLTNTSAQIITVGFDSLCRRRLIEWAHYCHNETLTQQLIAKKSYPELYITKNDDGVLLYLINATCDMDIKFNFGYVLSVIKNTSLREIPMDNTPESIRERYKALGDKEVLRKHMEIDPELFGKRIVNGGPKPFSSLIQKSEQRPRIITSYEYQILRDVYPHSVVELDNQTRIGQRLYIYCPYEEFSYINFHEFTYQRPIPRCTTKLSNIGQFTECAKELNADIQDIIQTKAQINTINTFKTYIAPGKRTYLPPELYYVFKGYTLWNPDKEIDYNAYDEIVLERDEYNQRYNIYSTRLTNNDWIIIKLRIGELEYPIVDSKFTFINMYDYEDILSMIIHYLKDKSTYSFISALCELLDWDIEYKPVLEITLIGICDKFNCKLIGDTKKVTGIVYNDMQLTLPTIITHSDMHIPITYFDNTCKNYVPYTVYTKVNYVDKMSFYRNINTGIIDKCKVYNTECKIEPTESVTAGYDIFLYDDNSNKQYIKPSENLNNNILLNYIEYHVWKKFSENKSTTKIYNVDNLHSDDVYLDDEKCGLSHEWEMNPDPQVVIDYIKVKDSDEDKIVYYDNNEFYLNCEETRLSHDNLISGANQFINKYTPFYTMWIYTLKPNKDEVFNNITIEGESLEIRDIHV